MQYPHTLLALILSISSFHLAFSQSGLESPVKLEYVVAQQVGSTTMGSFVVKNDYPKRDLSDHNMYWELSFEGKVIQSADYALGAIQPSETKYISLKKLFELQVLDDLGNGLVSIYAEIQDQKDAKTPVRIVGESAVLAEAIKAKINVPEQYHVIKVAGARIHRIANGNSITIDPYNQIVGMDLGNGNLLAGPIRPVIYYKNEQQSLETQRLVDSIGPSALTVDEHLLQGAIQYDLGPAGSLKLPFSFGESGLSISIENHTALHSPRSLGLDVPLREPGDTFSYLGHEALGETQINFGDTKLGFYELTLDSSTSTTLPETRKITSVRGNITGSPFNCLVQSVTGNSLGQLGISKHRMEKEMTVLTLERKVEPRRFRTRPGVKSKPVSGGSWMFVPSATRR